MTWALKRQILYIIILILFLAVVGSVILYPSFNKPPTCMDGKQNGAETGVDCGGSCARACTAEVAPLSVLWARSFQVVPGRYNAVAYLENPNKASAIQALGYRFRFADEKNVYVGKREGVAYVPPGGRFAIFEPAIDTGHSVPVYTTLEFTSVPVWVQVDEEKLGQLKISSSNINLQNPSTTPSLFALIKNNSLFTIPDMNVVAVLYDASGNAISASQTYIDNLGPEEWRSVDFTWPEAFTKEVVKTEIIPLYDIFKVELK